ncbi:MAG: fimbrial isopeptide formation D2 family protein, partial [Rhodothermales bacterium]
VASPVQVTFPAGSANGAAQIATVTVTQDLAVEANETVNLRLSNPSTGTLGATTNHAMTITEDDSVNVVYSTPTSSVAEATTTHNVIVSLVVLGGGNLEVALSIDVNDVLSGTATSAADYTALAAPLTLNFPIGASNGSSQVVPIGILADALIENDETLELALSNPSGSPVFSLGAQTSHQVTITNDDGSATVDFQSATSSIVEAGGTQSIVVVLSTPGGNLGSDVIVNITDLLTGTASSGGDYTTLDGPAQITFPSGSASGATAILGVGILDDGSTEGNEDIDLQITGTSGPGGLGSALAHALSIIDDDGNFLAFQTTTSNTAEIAGTHYLVIELTRPGGGTNANPLSVDVTDLLTGTATSATDYTALAIPVTVTFAGGVGNGATAVVAIGLINDVNFEANESINLRMSNIVSLDGVVLGSPTNHNVTVVDDDNLSVTKTASVATATIGETFTYTALITVPEGSITSVVATDTLPNNINFQAGTLAVVLGNGGMSTSFVNEATSASYADPVLTITFGTVNNPINGNTADDSITVTFDAIVANSATNNAGDTKTNSFSITNGLVVGADTADVGIVEGNISLTKAVENITRCSNPATGPIAGDSLQYTLSITEIQGQPIYDLTISDLLSEFMLYDASFTPTVSGAGNTIAAATVSGSGGGGDPQTLSWNLGLGNADIDIAAGASIVITYRVTVSGAISGGAGINNTATVGFSSIDGVSAGERSAGSAPGSDDYVETDSLVLSVRTAGTQFTIPASRRRNPTFIDANGIITGPGSPGTLDADDELVLTNGSGITFTGDGISGPPPAGAPDITVNASASAIINTDGTNTFAYGIVTINAGASLTLTGDSTFTMEQIVMAAGSTLTLAAGTNLTVTGPCELNGGVGTSNYVTVQASGGGNYSITFNCSFLGDHFRFNDVGSGKITFNGDTQMDFAILADGSGGPYVCYCDDDDVTWTNLAFGYGDGTAQSIETCGTGNVIVDGYASTITNVWIGGDATEIEGGGTVTWSNATPVRKLTGRAFADSAGGVRIEFRTEGESAISHFEIQRDRKTVGRVHSTAAEYEGANYNFHDHSAQPGVEYSYRIQAMDTNGTHHWHPLGKAEGGRLKAEGGKREASISRSAFSLQPSAFSVTIPNYQPATYASDTPVQTGSGHRATVHRSGLYWAPAAVYNLGKSLARIDDFVFVRELRDFYSDENVVFSGNFQTVGTPGVIPNPEPDGYLMGSQYIGRFRSDVNEAFSVNAHFPAGPNWFARKIITSEASLEVDVDVRSPQAGEATIVASIRGNTDSNHDLSIALNGTPVGTASWIGQGFRLVEITCDASLLTSGTNSVALRTSQSASSQRLDYVEIRTPASPALQDGGLLVRIGSSGTLSVPGTTHVINVTTFGAETEANANFVTGQLIYFADRIQTLDWEPVTLALPTVAESANYLIVAPEDWLADFANLADLREGSRISFEEVRDIYGGGIFGPAGLVRLSKRTQANYLLLGAGTTYDTRDFEGRGTATGIPTGWIQVDDGLSASDDLYSDDLRIAVGRFPARRRSEVVSLIAKILDYQAPNRVTLLSDKDDSQGGVDRFAVMQRALADTVSSNLIETSDKTAQVVRAEIADSILAGARLVAYQGHGGFQELGDNWIDAEHPEQVPPAAWILSTCLTGSYFVNSESLPTLAREMLGVPNGGAVSLICSTRFGHADDEHRIVQRSLELVAEGQSLGAVLRTLKQEMTGQTIKVYTLLGDPALGGLDFSERRTIHLRTPQAGALIGGPDPIEIRFSLTGDGWWKETLRISWSQHGSPWTPITDVQAQPGEPDYSLQWTPPTDGQGYSIRIQLAD